MKTLKKTLALVLSVVMMLSTMAVSASAVGSEKVTSIDGATVTAPDITYDGQAHMPQVTVTLKDGKVLGPNDFKVTAPASPVTAVGTYSITVEGLSPYTGTATGSFKIVEAPKTDISGATVDVSSAKYDGKKHTPSVTVTVNGQTLVAGTDYEVTPVSEKNSGDYKVTITGKGAYTGTVTGTFVIKADPEKKLPAATTIKTSGKTTVSNKKKQTVKLNIKKTKGEVKIKVLKAPKKAKKSDISYKNGKIVIKKGAKKGTYKIKITVEAYNQYKKVTKTVTIKVK